jgi:hypothetical protein
VTHIRDHPIGALEFVLDLETCNHKGIYPVPKPKTVTKSNPDTLRTDPVQQIGNRLAVLENLPHAGPALAKLEKRLAAIEDRMELLQRKPSRKGGRLTYEQLEQENDYLWDTIESIHAELGDVLND